MTSCLNGRTHKVFMGEDWIKRTGLIRTVEALTAEDGFHVAVLRAAFCHHEIVVAINLVQMGRFWELPTGTVTDHDSVTELFAGAGIDLEQRNSLLSLCIMASTTEI